MSGSSSVELAGLLGGGQPPELGQPGVLGADDRGQLLGRPGREAPRGQHRVQEPALAAGVLDGPGQGHEGRDGPGQGAVVGVGRDLGVDVDQLGDDAVVVAQHAGQGDRLAGRADLVALAVEPAQGRLGGPEPGLEALAVGGQVGPPELAPEPLEGLVDGHPLGDHAAVAAGLVAAHVPGGQVPLALELVHQAGQAEREGGDLVHPVGLAAPGQVVPHPQAGEHAQAQQRQDEDGGQFGLDRGVLQHVWASF
jgi:hypothetical protein